MKKKKFFSFWPDRQEKIFELLQEAKLGAMLGRITWYAKLPLDWQIFNAMLMMIAVDIKLIDWYTQAIHFPSDACC